MAGDYIITGGRPLNGTVRVPAAKNSVLPLLAASLLCSGPVRLCGVPELADVAESLALLRSAGCTAERQGADVRVDGVPGSGTLAAGPAGRMRASILFCAPLLARLGRAQTVLPGGCRIGARPIDLHLAGLVQMGACPQLEGERLLLTAPAGLHGADITLRFPSVGATETLLLAAALAQGETTLRGAAREPEIEDLAAFLNRCGGRVQGAGTGTVRVQGVRRLHGCSFAPLPVRITAATFACACAAAGGRVELAGCAPRLYAPVLEILEQMGCGIVRRSDAAVITRFGRLYGPGRVFTGAYPALATDAAPLLAAVMLVFLYAAQPEIFGSLGGLLRQLLFLSLFPLLAYPVQPMIPSFREKGREGQRHLAMIFAFAGHLFDGIVNICVPSSRELILIGWVYLLSGIAILLCNRLFRLRASGHAAGVGAVIGLLVLTGHPRTLAVTLPLLFLVFWASIAAKRHTLPQLIGGTLIPIAWCVLLSSYIVDSYR